MLGNHLFYSSSAALRNVMKNSVGRKCLGTSEIFWCGTRGLQIKFHLF